MESEVLLAVGEDGRNDSFFSGLTILSSVIFLFTGFSLDAYAVSYTHLAVYKRQHTRELLEGEKRRELEIRRVVNSILGECDRNNISTVTGDGIYPENRIDFTPYMERYQCSLDEVTEMINSGFAEITYRIFKAEDTFKGLYTSGGDITVAVCKKFDTAGLSLLDEVLPLAAYGQFLKGEFEGVHIITKGGRDVYKRQVIWTR